MEKKNKPNSIRLVPLKEGKLKNNQEKPSPNIKREAVLKPPPAKPKKK